MTFEYDQSVDTLDIELAGGLVARTEQLDEGTLVDLDEHGRILSIEVIHPARRWPLDEILERFDVDEQDANILTGFWAGPERYPFAEAAPLGAEGTTSELAPA